MAERRLSGLEPGGYCRQGPERDTMGITDERTTMTFDIEVGGEPPSARSGRASAGKYVPIAQRARDAAGEWVSVKGVNQNVAGAIRKGDLKGFAHTDAGWFEATNRDVIEDDDGHKTCTLWVRYHTGRRVEA